MRGRALAVLLAAGLVAGAALADPSAPSQPATPKAKVAPTPPTAAQRAAGPGAFRTVYRVLLSPRCKNCHPAGDAPLQTDAGVPHAMNVTRLSFESGLKCTTCHGTVNADVLGIASGPPGAPHWQLPPKKTPMIFEGRSASALCAQLNDPAQTGGRDLAALNHHVNHDALVRWGWKPGGKRTLPPVPYKQFVAAFQTWVDSGGTCP